MTLLPFELIRGSQQLLSEMYLVVRINCNHICLTNCQSNQEPFKTRAIAVPKMKYRFPSFFAVDTLRPFGPWIQNLQIKSTFFTWKLSFLTNFEMWIRKFANKKFTNNEGCLHYWPFLKQLLLPVKIGVQRLLKKTQFSRKHSHKDSVVANDEWKRITKICHVQRQQILSLKSLK